MSSKSKFSHDEQPRLLDHDVHDHDALRRSFSHYPSGVAAIAALIDGEPRVLVSSSFMVGISLDPPLVSFAVQHTSQSWPQLRRADLLGVSVLAAEQQGLCRQLSGRDRAERFAGVAIFEQDDAIFFEGSAAWMLCRVHEVVRAGDHDIVVLRLEANATDTSREPLVFHGSSFRPLATMDGGEK